MNDYITGERVFDDLTAEIAAKHKITPISTEEEHVIKEFWKRQINIGLQWEIIRLIERIKAIRLQEIADNMPIQQLRISSNIKEYLINHGVKTIGDLTKKQISRMFTQMAETSSELYTIRREVWQAVQALFPDFQNYSHTDSLKKYKSEIS